MAKRPARGRSTKGPKIVRPDAPPLSPSAQRQQRRTLDEALANARRMPRMIFASGDPRVELVGHAMSFRGPISENLALWELRKMEALMGPGHTNYGQRILDYLRIQEEERSARQAPTIPAKSGKFKLPPAALADHMKKYPRSSGLSGEDRIKILLREHGVRITRSALVKRLRTLPT
jgi:hypothetical protein